jgi:predicted RNA-binding Zn ribbon-like protein
LRALKHGAEFAMEDMRPALMFVADAHALDFLNTVATPAESAVEWLGSGEDLLVWLEQAGLITADIASAVRAGTIPGELDAIAERARLLREWFRGFVLAHAGHPVGSKALPELQPLNRLLAQDEAYGEIVASATHVETPAKAPHDHGLDWRWSRRWRAPDELLLPIAQAMADLVCEADFTMVKQCEGPTCTVLFLDTTKGHARRWCSMALCGNRAKQASHRARAKRAPAKTSRSSPGRKKRSSLGNL